MKVAFVVLRLIVLRLIRKFILSVENEDWAKAGTAKKDRKRARIRAFLMLFK
jgi:hypothetical protein